MNHRKNLYLSLFLVILAGLYYVDVQGGSVGRRGSVNPTENLRPVAIENKDIIQNCTFRWTGERMDDGRPYVPTDIIERMKNVSITQAWSTCIDSYPCSYTTGKDWFVIHSDQVICGRVLTAQYMPLHPDYNAAIKAQGQKEGRKGESNSWPIDMLKPGDVYVADGFGKVLNGTLIGDNLGNAIYTNSGNGVIFNAGVRDLEGLEAIEGFNAWYKGADPSFLQNAMLTAINVPIRIGDAVACPGDIVLAKPEGIVFIPAHLAEEVVTQAESTMLRDMFGHQRLQEKKYTPGQIDSRWIAEIQDDFRNWLEENIDELPVPREVIEEQLNSEQRNW